MSLIWNLSKKFVLPWVWFFSGRHKCISGNGWSISWHWSPLQQTTIGLPGTQGPPSIWQVMSSKMFLNQDHYGKEKMPCVINRLYQLPFQQMLLVRGFFFPVGCELKYIPPVSYIKHPLGIWDQEPSDRYLAFTLSDEANVTASEHSCAVVKSVMPKSEPYSEHAKPFSV